MAPFDLAITAVGMASSLGLDATTACAAARAGLVRATALPFDVPDPETNDPTPAVGHPIGGMTLGFDGAGRLLRVAGLALDDLVRGAPPARLAAARWLVALPEPLPSAPPAPGPDAPPARPGPPRVDADAVRAAVGRALGAPVDARRFAAYEGRAGFVAALADAARAAQGGEACVVGAFDTLLDTDVLGALLAHGRLNVGAGTGFQPGEAGAFFVTEAPERARGAGLAARGVVRAAATAHEPDHLYSGRPGVGRALADLVDRLPAAPFWPFSDCNGEVYRAKEWGYAGVRSARLRPTLGATTYPAAAFGETGAASPAVALALALHGFARRCAPAPAALLLAADALGPRGAALVHAA